MSSSSSSARGRGRGRGGPRSVTASRSDTPTSVGGASMSEVMSGMSQLSVGSISSAGTRSTEAELEEIKSLLPRPGYGTAGRLIPLITNYFELKMRAPVTLHHYEVSITRPGRDRRLDRDECRDVFWKLVTQNRSLFGKETNLIYDDASSLLAGEKLPAEKAWVRLELKSPAGRVTHLVEIKFTNSVTIDLNVAMSAAVSDQLYSSRTLPPAIQFLDALISQGVRCPFSPVSRRFYPFGRSIYFIPYSDQPHRQNWAVNVGAGIEAWRGLHGAIKFDEDGKALLNADVSTSAFYKIEMGLIEFFLEVLSEFRGAHPRTMTPDVQRILAMDESQRRRLNKALTGVQLRLTYGGENSRPFKFGEVGKSSRHTTFKYRERDDPNDPGVTCTVEDYFQRHKNMPLQFPLLPVIRVGPKQKNICIPMELLKISDRPQKVKRELTEFQKAKLIRDASMKPRERMGLIREMTAMQNLENDDFMQNFNVSVSNELLRINGRVIAPPELALLHPPDQPEPYHIPVHGGAWPLRNRFKSAAKNVVFEVINVDGSFSAKEFWNPFEVLFMACCNFGIEFAYDGKNTFVSKWRPGSKDELRSIVETRQSEVYRNYGAGVRVMFIFLMTNKLAPIYAQIKTVCDIEVGVACQVILKKVFLHMNDSNSETNATAHNIVLKMNVKLGGINNEIYSRYSVWPKFSDKNDPTIFIGIDVTHPKPGKRGNSLATVVGSTNFEASKYEVTVKVQMPGAERVVYVVDAIKDRVLAFYKSTGCRPTHIVIYRDGISESEFLETVREEVVSVMAACRKLDPTYMPTITYIVVQKRHHTRFFVENPGDAVKDNIPPGTVVDRRVVSGRLFDFFLSSHLGAIGTSRPSHYYVLYDSWGLSADEWQQVTYALCHLYCRCARSVSIPAPVYYAHLACYRASVHDDALHGGRSSQSGSQSGDRGDAPSGRSELETSRTHQASITVATSAPAMYFV